VRVAVEQAFRCGKAPFPSSRGNGAA
jgi:hypothetical protein